MKEFDEKKEFAEQKHAHAMERQDRAFEHRQESTKQQSVNRASAIEAQGENALALRQFDANFLPRRHALETAQERRLSEIRIEEHAAVALKDSLLAEVAFDREMNRSFLEIAGKLIHQKNEHGEAKRTREHALEMERLRITADASTQLRTHDQSLEHTARQHAQERHMAGFQASLARGDAVLKHGYSMERLAAEQAHQKDMVQFDARLSVLKTTLDHGETARVREHELAAKRQAMDLEMRRLLVEFAQKHAETAKERDHILALEQLKADLEKNVFTHEELIKLVCTLILRGVDAEQMTRNDAELMEIIRAQTSKGF